LPTSDEEGESRREPSFPIEIDISPDASGIDALHDAVASAWSRFTPESRPSTQWQSEFTTAVGEIVSNVIRHSIASSEPSSPIHVAIRRSGDSLEARLVNAGAAFEGIVDEQSHLAESIDPLDLPEGQYGLLLARQTLDDLRYERDQQGMNVWTLVKALPTQ
jgi:anti-sigma regulatory factor (Ser/Thr protein kinase)